MQHEATIHRYSGITLPRLKGISQELLDLYGDHKIWLFYGEMGTGKTTLIKEICRHLGVQDIMSSPTFTLVNEYRVNENKNIFHFDFYRLKNEREAVDIGIEEYFYSGNYCFVEWPEKIPSLLPADLIQIKITSEDSNHRTIEVTINAH